MWRALTLPTVSTPIRPQQREAPLASKAATYSNLCSLRCLDAHVYTPTAFIGTGPTNFALSGVRDEGAVHAHGYDWISFFFQYAFAAAV